MPVHPVKGQPGCYQWGESGKVYCGDGAKEKAEAQGRAAYASGYKGKAEMQMPMESKYQEGDDRWWLFHKWEVRDDKTLMTYQDNGRFKIWVLINPYHFNGRMKQDGKLTFICTTKHADAKEECLNWISANLPEVKEKSPFYARKDREQFSRDKRYYSVEFDGLTYREEGFGRKRLDGYAGFRADEDKKNFTTIEDVKIGDVFKFGDGWERFVLKSKEIYGYEWDSKADEEVVVYKIVFDPYKPSPVSDIEGLVRSNAKIVRWDNVRLQMARRRLELGAEESEQMGLESFREGLYHLYLKGKITEAECAAWSDDYEDFLQGEAVEKPPFAAETFEAESKPYSVEISRSSNPEKKLMAVFSDKEGNKIKTTHFGQRGASDYTKHGDRERMERYLERHGGGTTTSTKEDWKDPTTAGSLSRWILWNKPSLSGSFSDYKRRFGLKGTMKVSKSAEQVFNVDMIKERFFDKQLAKYGHRLNWEILSQNPSLTPALIEKYEDKWNWSNLSTNPSLTPALIEKYEDKWDWDFLAQNPSLTPAVIEKYEHRWGSWGDLSYHRSLTPAFIQKYENRLNWSNLSENASLTPALIEKYEDKWDWNRLSRNRALTPALIEKYEDKWNWNWISKNPCLTPALIEKYEDKWNWGYLSENHSLTPAVIEKYEDKLNWDILSKNPSLTLAVIEKYEDKWNWIQLSLNRSLTPAVIEKYEDKLNWSALTQYTPLTPALIEKNEDRINWKWLSSNPSLTPAVIEKYIDKWNWERLSANPALFGNLYVKKAAEGSLSPAQKSLNKWTREDWGTKSGKPSTQGEDATGERYLPRKAREALTDREYARTSAKKRRDTAKGKQFSPQPDDVEEKTAKYRSETFEAEKPLHHNVYCTLCGQDFQSVNRKWETMGKARKQQILSSWIQKHYRKKHPEEYKKWFDFMYENGYDAAYHEYGLPVDTKEIFEAEQVFNVDMIKERFFDKQLKKYGDRLDWMYLSKNPSLTPALIEKYEDKWDWNWISKNPSLTPALIEKYNENVDWGFLTDNPSLTPAVIEKYDHIWVVWSDLSYHPSLTPALIEKYEDKWDWDTLSNNLSLTPAVIEKYEDKWDWNRLSRNRALTPALIEKYKDKLRWLHLSANPSLTPALIEKYEDKWDWDFISSNPSLTPAVIEKYENKWNWRFLSPNRALTPALIEKYEDKLKWDGLSLNPSLTPALIEKWEAKLNWSNLSENPSLTPAVIEKYEDKWKWDTLSKNSSLTPAVIEKYIDKWNWERLSANPALFGNLYVKKAAEQVFEAIEGKGSKARFTDQPDPKIYRDPSLRQKARNDLLKGTKGGDAGEWSARKAQMAATRYRTLYENKYGEGKNPYFAEEEKPLALRDMVELKDVTKRDLPNGGEQVNLFYMVLGSKGDAYRYTIQSATSERPIHQCTCKGWQFGKKRAAKGLPRCKHERMVKTVQMITDKSPDERKQLLRSIGNGDDEYAQSLGFESRRQAILDVGSFLS